MRADRLPRKRRRRRTSVDVSFDERSNSICGRLPTIFVDSPRYSKKQRGTLRSIENADESRLPASRNGNSTDSPTFVGCDYLRRPSRRPRSTRYAGERRRPGRSKEPDQSRYRSPLAARAYGAPDRVRSLLLALGRGLLGSFFLVIYALYAAPAPFWHDGQYRVTYDQNCLLTKLQPTGGHLVHRSEVMVLA